ncbi:MAG: YfhO family protein [Thermoanaerobaculia bacterium]|nr:YfhO family protein [Thermoanaerobaculia bacterium]
MRHPDVAALLTLFATVAVFFADLFVGGRALYLRDLTRYYFPMKRVIREVLLSGHFPFWNHSYAAGQPMAANPEYEIFYPPQWLILLPDYLLGFNLHIVAHVALTVLGMFLLARSLEMGRIAAMFTAVAWGLGGVAMSLINLLPILFALAWTPLIILFTRRFAIDRLWRDAGLAALCAGAQMLVGEPTSILQTWAIIGGWVVWRAWSDRKERTLRGAAGSSLIILVWSLAIGAVQLLPAWDLMRDTVRARGLSLDLVTAWSFPWQRLIELAYPHIHGYYVFEDSWMRWGSLYERGGSPFIMSLYSGAVLVPLLIAGLTRRDTGRFRFLALSTPFLVVALGSHTPLYQIVHSTGLDIPFRYPEKLIVGFMFCVILFCGTILDRIIEGDRALLHRALAAALALFGVAALALVAIASGIYDRSSGILFPSGAAPARLVDAVQTGWLVAALSFAAVAVILGAMKARPNRLWPALLILVTGIEALVLSFEVSPRIDHGFFTAPPVVDDLAPDRDDYRLFHEVDWYFSSPVARQWSMTGEDRYWVLRNGLYPVTPLAWGFRTALERDFDATALAPTREFVEAMWEVRDAGQTEWASIFMSMANVRYRNDFAGFREAVIRSGGDPRKIEPVVIIDEGPSPRYYFASILRKAEDASEFVKALESEVPHPRVAFVAFEPFEPSGGVVRRVEETPSGIELDVSAEGRSFLVLSVTAHDYWRATVDGSRREIHRTNVGFQGIVIEEGEREVRLVYRNPWIVATMPVSLLAIIAALWVVAAPVKLK